MILIRQVFRLKFGKAKEVKTLMQESKKLMDERDLKNSRAMFDLTGPAYTLVMEFTSDSLSQWESEMNNMNSTNNKEWGEWYQKFSQLVESSSREIYTIAE
ncbi:MAG: hypothetical protein JWN78_2279 [Bacteroidota bacterium]|nr:hypothetical protein [Bacteroidota bacterium]